MAVNIFIKYTLTLALIAQCVICQSLFSSLPFDQHPSLASTKNGDESSKTDSNIPHFTFPYEEIDEFIDRVMTCKDIFGTGLAIVQLDENDQIVDQYAKGYGIRDPVHPDIFGEVDNKTQFCLGSITKQFTAATLGKHLVKKGKNFDTRLINLLGEEGRFFGDRDLGALPTVRDILSHRMAIPRYDQAWGIGLEEKREEIWRRLHMLADDYDDEYLAKSYRSSFQYNNWMVTLAGYALENITGQTWEAEINDTYFRPLEMEDSSFAHESYGDPEKFALPAYRIRNDTGGEDIFMRIDPAWFRYTANFVAPAGSICMSSEDMLKYVTFLVRTNVSEQNPMKPLKDSIDKTWFQASNPIRAAEFSDFASPKEDYVFESDEYALCVERGIYREYKQINHGGDIFGYNSYIMIFPELKLGILMSNSQGYTDPVYALPITLGLFDIVTKNTASSLYTADQICERNPNVTAQPDPDSLKPEKECYKTIDKSLDLLTGVYRHPVFGNLTVSYNESGFDDGFHFKMNWGIFGAAILCQMEDSKNDNEFEFHFNQNGPLWYYNEEKFHKYTTLRFVKDAGGRGVKVIFPFLQLTAPSVESVTFTNVAYDPCNPSLCMNGGKCVPISDLDYRCECPKPLNGTNCEIAPKTDCTDIKKYYPDLAKKSGVYRIEIPGTTKESYNVYCDMETDNGGWTLIQRRTNDISSQFKGEHTMYDQYVMGFGLPGKTYNYWIGLEAMQALAGSAEKNYTLRIDLTDCSDKSVYEEYQNFWLGDASTNYTLHLQAKSATGSAGDALTVSNSYISHNNMPFSAPGKVDKNGCVQAYNSGWWFNNCFDCNLNGKYYDDCTTNGNTDGIVWLPFHNGKYSMEFASMKIRRSGVIA